jgi:hypothetical protein
VLRIKINTINNNNSNNIVMGDSPEPPPAHPLSAEALRAARLLYFVPPASAASPFLEPESDSAPTPALANPFPAAQDPSVLVVAPRLSPLVDDPSSAASDSAPTPALAAQFIIVHSSDSEPDSAPYVCDLASYTTASLPGSLRLFKKNEYKKYRDAVCDLLQLSFIPIDGQGDCFFASLSRLLQYQRALNLNAHDLRQQVVQFLRECQNKEHSILGERCVVDMEGELGEPVTGLSRKNSGLTPDTVDEYLDVSAIDGVWVQGYHWPRAVAAIFNCCVVVVVHGHQYLYLFGDPAHERFHFYKRDVETHYDALPRSLGSNTSHPPVLDDDTALLALAFAASSTSSSSDDQSIQRQRPPKRSARLCHQASASSVAPSQRQPVRKSPRGGHPITNDCENARANPVPEPAPVVQLRVSAPNSKDVGTKVELDDTLLVLPPKFKAQGWPEAKLYLLGLMKRTGHSGAFTRTSKLPPKHNTHWAKIICPACPCSIIGTADSDGLDWTINSEGHGICTYNGSSSLIGAPAVSQVSVTCSVLSEVVSWYCYLCQSHNDNLDFAFCSHPLPHKLCSECFDNYVTFKVTGTEKADFIQSNCIVKCPTPGCTHSVDMRVCAQHMSTKGYDLYMSCLSETQIIAVQKECEERVNKLKAARFANGTIAPIADEFTEYVQHIATELILPRCPNTVCRTQITDFDACSALQCGRMLVHGGVEEVTGGCGAHFCGWCCTICKTKSECHEHVRNCPFNPAEG